VDGAQRGQRPDGVVGASAEADTGVEQFTPGEQLGGARGAPGGDQRRGEAIEQCLLRGQVHNEPHQLLAPRGIDQTAVLEHEPTTVQPAAGGGDVAKVRDNP
jgi:hypothetical protein